MTSHPHPTRVLVVDDTPVNLALLLDTLGQAGHRVLIAESGLDALAILARTPPDLILMDVVMPGLDGFATCARIRANPTWANIPLLFMTSIDSPGEKVRAFEGGAIDYIVKPVYPPEVLARVNAHLQLRALRRDLEQRNEQLQSEIDLRLDAEAQLAHSLDRAVITTDASGTTLFATRLAAALLEKYFPGQRGPTPPAALLAGATGVEQGDHSLLIRRFAGAPGDDVHVYFLEEKNAPPGPGALMALGLTARQAEVLYWIAQGKANGDIATILGTSPRTVHKHVERIFERLGVENRASAMLTAGEVLRAG